MTAAVHIPSLSKNLEKLIKSNASTWTASDMTAAWHQKTEASNIIRQGLDIKIRRGVK